MLVYKVNAGKFHCGQNVTRVTGFSVELQVTIIFIINSLEINVQCIKC